MIFEIHTTEIVAAVYKASGNRQGRNLLGLLQCALQRMSKMNKADAAF